MEEDNQKNTTQNINYPEFSIIINFDNDLSKLKECLWSIKNNFANSSFEVIILHDENWDEMINFLQLFENVKAVRKSNEETLLQKYYRGTIETLSESVVLFSNHYIFDSLDTTVLGIKSLKHSPIIHDKDGEPIAYDIFEEEHSFDQRLLKEKVKLYVDSINFYSQYLIV